MLAPQQERSRNLARPLTVVNRFTVKGDVPTFEREFRAHSQHLRHQAGFDFLVTVQLVERPDVYVHLGHWRSLAGFLKVVHDETFLAHVQRLGAMVETEADQAVSVRRVTVGGGAGVGVPAIVLTHGQVTVDCRAFEERFADLTHHCAGLGGFGGSDLLRSTLRPLSYLGVSWWESAEACDRALRDEGYLAQRERLAQAGRIATERTRHIAYERVIAG
ncbi:antibiotic biosynthesis monooxygenase family protein [Streptomyces sp. URMC 123]|uniref:antibiotic biosynthesis monooxygenase family protein n=1 Tax=Streptomyces sp. URMC 123 TaxID=3423403 RepID=UPI003F1DB1F8